MSDESIRRLDDIVGKTIRGVLTNVVQDAVGIIFEDGSVFQFEAVSFAGDLELAWGDEINLDILHRAANREKCVELGVITRAQCDRLDAHDRDVEANRAAFAREERRATYEQLKAEFEK